MDLKIKVRGGIITLKNSSYVTSGGEGSIYINGGKAFKIYHNSNRCISPKKIQELSTISNSYVVIPHDIIFDITNGKMLGYVTNFITDSNPILKYFTKSFKNDNNITIEMIVDLVKKMQQITSDIHKSNCLVVDYNELNILVKNDASGLNPFYIDTDSYATPSFKATAVMDSIRDRKVSSIDKNGLMHYNPDELSDWFSFAVIAFYLYSNIHPYRGNHPNYRPRDKQKQMDDGISVFHPGVRVPPCVNDFRIIPKRHLDWFKDIFLNNNRSVPPLPDSSVPLLVPTQIITIQGTDKIEVSEIISYPDSILDVKQMMGVYYVATKTHFYSGKKEIGVHNAKKIKLCLSSDGTLIVAEQGVNNKIIFRSLTRSDPVGTATSKEMFSRNNAIYTISHDKLIENTFISFGEKIIHRTKEIDNVSAISSKMYDGCVIQDLLGKMYITLPYKEGSCFSKHISQLDGYRVIDARSEKNVVVIVGEKKGQYDRFIIIFNKDYSRFDVRKVDDITYDGINFAAMDNGLCVLLSSPTELELFVNTNQCEVIKDPPFDSTMKLFTTPDGIFFIMNNSIHQIKKK